MADAELREEIFTEPAFAIPFWCKEWRVLNMLSLEAKLNQKPLGKFGTENFDNSSIIYASSTERFLELTVVVFEHILRSVFLGRFLEK